MKRKLLGLLALLMALGGSARGQNPTAVTGTITDPSSIAYYPAQVTACLSPVTIRPTVGGQLVNSNIGTNYCIGPVSTALNGSFSMGLHANANIVPGGTTWIFTVTALGSAPPAGTGSQTFQSSGITISGASQDVGATLSALAPKLLAAGGGVSSQRTINAIDAKYNLPATGYYSCVANYSNVSTTLAIDTAVDNPFTSTMVGWQVFLSNGPCQGSNGAGTPSSVHFNGTIAAFIDSSHVTLSGTPSGTCAGKQSAPIVSCRAYYVPSDSAAALNAAWGDATGLRGCATLILPSGVYKFNTAIKSTGSCGPIAALATGTAMNGPSVKGQSMSSTILVADPAFDASTCPTGCVWSIGAQQSLYISDMTISGGGNGTVTNGSGKCKISNPSWPSVIENVQLDYWGQNTSGFTGLCWSGTNQGQSFVKNVNVYNGGFNCATLGIVSIYDLFCMTPAGSTVTIGGGAATDTYIHGSTFIANTAGGFALTVSGAGACAAASNSAELTIDSSTITGSINNGALADNQGCPVIIEKSKLTSSAGTNLLIGNSGNGIVAQLKARDSVITGGVTNLGGTVAGSSFLDEGGNVFSGPSTLTNLTIVADGHSLKGACTGVATASQTLGLYGTGPNVTLTTCTSTAIGSGAPIQGARTAANLIVSATAAGTNASSGVVTVLKNGVATTITCTIGTGISCQDGTHTASFADGDLISIQFTTQAADTLAGVKAIVEWN